MTYHLDDVLPDRSLMLNLKSISALLGLAVERCLLLEEAAEAKAAARSEILKDALRSSVSHDLRTPVTVIQAAAGAWRSKEVSLSDQDHEKFLGTILEQCAKLDRYTSELLDVGQIQSGISEDKLEIIDLNEIIRLALKHAQSVHPMMKVDRKLLPEPAYIR